MFRRRNGRTEILLIEDRYSRWTLPKGKREKGETIETTALREIREETGVLGRILRPLTSVQYRYFHPDSGYVDKEVQYYLVEAQSETLNPALSEINGAKWFSPEEAWRIMHEEGYDNNLPVITAAYQHLGLSPGGPDDTFHTFGGKAMTVSNLASMIDHTLLKPEATAEDIDRVCREALEHGFAAVCVNPWWVSRAAEQLKESSVKVCTPVGFPLGVTTTEAKVAETKRAIKDGASEIDMVMNIGAFKSGDHKGVEEDIRAVVRAAEGYTVKVILETGYLDEEEIRQACELAKAAGAHFVKTSTGFGPGGATVEAVRIMRGTVGREMGVKASGGIRTLTAAKKMVSAGANRIGTSSGVAIVEEMKSGE